MIRPILRKGDFTASILSTIVAVAGILLIGFLAVKLYTFFKSQDEKNAGEFMDSIQGKINALEVDESNTFSLRGLEDWVLVAWNKDVLLNDKPQKCFDKNCLCLCKELPDKDTCQENGLFRFIDEKVSVSSKLREETGGAGDEKIVDYSATCAYTYKELMNVFISKSSQHTSIAIDYGVLKDTNAVHSDLIYNKGKTYYHDKNKEENPFYSKLGALECHLNEKGSSPTISPFSGGGIPGS